MRTIPIMRYKKREIEGHPTKQWATPFHRHQCHKGHANQIKCMILNGQKGGDGVLKITVL